MAVEQAGVTTTGLESSAAVLATRVRNEPGVKLGVLHFAAETERPRWALALCVLVSTLWAVRNRKLRTTYEASFTPHVACSSLTQSPDLG